MNKWGKYLWLLIFFAICLFYTLNTTYVIAALTSDQDLQTLKQAPEGIPIQDYLTQTSPNTSKIFKTNSAQLIDNTGNNSKSSSIISLASGPNTYGAMWSKNETFDINKKHTISAWLYFSNDGSSNPESASDGIAFVLQNDSHGTSSLGAGLQGMGVYGFDASYYGPFTSDNANPIDIINSAVQNSMALEFDTKLNRLQKSKISPTDKNDTPFELAGTSKYYSLNGYDTDLSSFRFPFDLSDFQNTPLVGTGTKGGGANGHIALTYPGYIKSYQPVKLLNFETASMSPLPWTNGYILVHESPVEVGLNQGVNEDKTPRYWHHVIINWTPPKADSHFANLTYYFHDKNQDYSTNTAASWRFSAMRSQSLTVDTSKLNTTSGLVRWGFTAANGSDSNVQSKLVVLDSIPELLSATASSNIVDKTLNNKIITDNASDIIVGSGDHLQLNYNLTYDSGNSDWENIVANINLPQNLSVYPDTEGNIGTITYDNGIIEKISANGNLQHTLIKALGTTTNATGKKALVSINAQAFNDTKNEISINKAIARFSSPSEITFTSTPHFKISAGKDYTLNLKNLSDNNDINLIYKQPNVALNLPTSLSYSDNHSFDGNNIIYQINVNNKQNYTIATNATGTDFKQTINLKSIITNDTAFWNLFSPGATSQITVKAIDTTNGFTSNLITYNVKVNQDKSLSLSVSKLLRFRDINYLSTLEYLPRKTNFVLQVTSKMEPWQLVVSTNGLFLSEKIFNDKMALVYKKDDASPYLALNSIPTLVAEDPTPHTDITTTDISKKWKQNTGILLKQHGISSAGSYSGKLTWTIYNSVNNT